MPLHIQTFGGLHLTLVDPATGAATPLALPGERARQFFAYLITMRRTSHARLTPAGLFWPDLPEERARRNLSHVLWKVQQAMSLEHVPEHRLLIAAWQATQPQQIVVQLPAADAPGNAATISVTWTITAPDDDSIADLTLRRRHRLRSLLNEAQTQGAAPTRRQLAETLGVSVRTSERDIAGVRGRGSGIGSYTSYS
jgi:predicted DNA-binding transcriptional regulator YafY